MAEPTAEQIAAELTDNPAGLDYWRAITVDEVAEYEAYNLAHPGEEIPVPSEKLRPPAQLVNLMTGTRTQPNPEPQPDVYLPAAERAENVRSVMTAKRISGFDAASIQIMLDGLRGLTYEDFEDVQLFLELGVEWGHITEVMKNQGLARLWATQPDPDWPATIPLEPRCMELWGVGSVNHEQGRAAIAIADPPIPSDEEIE